MNTPDRHEWVVPRQRETFRGLHLEYLDPADPDERRVLIEAEHPEHADALEAGEQILVDGEPMDPRLHVTIHEVVAAQVWDLDGFRTDLAGLPASWEAERDAGAGSASTGPTGGPGGPGGPPMNRAERRAAARRRPRPHRF